MIVLTILRSSSKMGTMAPVVSEIFEKTGAYVNRMFLHKKIFFCQKSIKIEMKTINKLSLPWKRESGHSACTDKFLTKNTVERITLYYFMLKGISEETFSG